MSVARVRQPAGRHRRHSGAALAVVALAIASACGGSSGTRSVSGHLRVSRMDLLAEHGPEERMSCPSAGLSAPDVADGATVVVHTGTGKQVAQAKLREGQTYRDFQTSTGGCEWSFTVDLPPAAEYRFIVGAQPPITRTATEVDKQAKDLVLVLPG